LAITFGVGEKPVIEWLSEGLSAVVFASVIAKLFARSTQPTGNLYMFTRSPSPEPTPLRPANPDDAAARSAPPRSRSGEALPKSVIGDDLKIIGQGPKIISEGMLQVDGDIEGDVKGVEVIVGGTVLAERVIVRGTVFGVIRGVSITLQSSCHVESDIHHMSLAIEQGAHFHGHSRREKNEASLRAAV
jgi:cytoskeletal protein CcmA (bactofilin family)